MKLGDRCKKRVEGNMNYVCGIYVGKYQNETHDLYHKIHFKVSESDRYSKAKLSLHKHLYVICNSNSK